jgi:hypothetical protein
MLCLGSGLLRVTAEAAPRIRVETPRREIPELLAGESAEVAFSLSNTGTDPLRIVKVSTNCGCTTTSYPAALAPGEKGVLKATMAANILWQGRVEKQITVISNDPEQPEVRLQFAAQIRPLIHFTPAIPISIPYKKGEVVRQVVTLRSDLVPPVAVTAATAVTPGTEARLLPAEGTDETVVARVEVTVRTPENGGDFTSMTLLDTTHPKVTQIPLTLQLISQSPITVRPPMVYLTGLGSQAATGPPPIFTLFKRTSAFRIVQMAADNPALQLQLRGAGSGDAPASNYYEIAVSYRGGLPKGAIRGMIVITTDDPQAPKLEVPYQATVE